MADAKSSRGMIAVDKMGTKVLFLNPVTYETEVVLEDFPRTVHELLVVPEANLAYVPIFGDGIQGRNPNPGHLLCIIDLEKRCSPASADGRILVAVDDAQPSSLFLIDTADGRVTNEVRLEGVLKAAQIARCVPDNSLIGVTSLNSGTVSLEADRNQGWQSVDGHGIPR